MTDTSVIAGSRGRFAAPRPTGERTASGRSYFVTPTNFPSQTSTKVDTPIRSAAHSRDNGERLVTAILDKVRA